MIITTEILEQGKSGNGAWSKVQIELLGGEWGVKGWKQKLIGSNVPAANIEQFLALKDSHLLNLSKDRLVELAHKHFFTEPPTAEFRAECPFDLWPDEFYAGASDLKTFNQVLGYIQDWSFTDAPPMSEPPIKQPTLF